MTWRIAQRRGDWDVAIESTTRVACDAGSFRVEADIVAFEGSREVARHRLERTIPRDLI